MRGEEHNEVTCVDSLRSELWERNGELHDYEERLIGRRITEAFYVHVPGVVLIRSSSLRRLYSARQPPELNVRLPFRPELGQHDAAKRPSELAFFEVARTLAQTREGVDTLCVFKVAPPTGPVRCRLRGFGLQP